MLQRTNITNYGYTGTLACRMAWSPFRRSGDEVVDYILSTTDYDPFGMILNGRDWNPDRYRFGFNGQEKTDEIKGTGNHLDFKYRGYDPQTGRFWSVDPLFKDYPWNSTYCFAENDVIRAKDLEGLEKLIVNNPNAYEATTYFLKIIKEDDVLKKSLYQDISKKELKEKVYIYFGVAEIQGANGVTYGEENLDFAAEYNPGIFKNWGISVEEYKERKAKGIKQLGVFVDKQVPNKKQVKTLAHEILWHLKNRIKGIKKTVEEEHKKAYTEDYYKKSGEDPYYSPSDENVPSNSPQGEINTKIDNAAEKVDNKSN